MARLPALVIDRDDLYGNVIRGTEVAFDREMAKLGGPVTVTSGS